MAKHTSLGSSIIIVATSSSTSYNCKTDEYKYGLGVSIHYNIISFE